MNCLEFEARWNDVLDARSEGLPDLERDLEAHATTCERCQSISIRYQLLRQAVAVWGPPPVPSIAAVEALRRLSFPSRTSRASRHRSRGLVALAMAAAIFGMAWVSSPWWAGRSPKLTEKSPKIAQVAPTRPIEFALEQATSATIDLALKASAPAARIGRDVLNFDQSETPSVPSSPEPDVGSAVAVGSAGDMLQTVGDRVKPITGSARHAFSFLLGPAPELEKAPNPSRGSL
jgi:hypothetical protein